MSFGHRRSLRAAGPLLLVVLAGCGPKISRAKTAPDAAPMGSSAPAAPMKQDSMKQDQMKLAPMPSTLCGPGWPPFRIDPCVSTAKARTWGNFSLK